MPAMMTPRISTAVLPLLVLIEPAKDPMSVPDALPAGCGSPTPSDDAAWQQTPPRAGRWPAHQTGSAGWEEILRRVAAGPEGRRRPLAEPTWGLENPHTATGTAWVADVPGTRGGEAGARGSRLAATWQSGFVASEAAAHNDIGAIQGGSMEFPHESTSSSSASRRPSRRCRSDPGSGRC
jgi:hypothetical protein